jgi:hypothetical protein
MTYRDMAAVFEVADEARPVGFRWACHCSGGLRRCRGQLKEFH